MNNKQIDLEFYKHMRAEGVAPTTVKSKWIDTINQDFMGSMVNVAIYSVVIMSILSIIRKRNYFNNTIWVTSPSGKTTIRLPIINALRIVRKRGWSITKTYPLRKVSRREALNILIHGDKICQS